MRGDGSRLVVVTTAIIALMLATLPLAFQAPWLVLAFAVVGAGFILAATMLMRRRSESGGAMRCSSASQPRAGRHRLAGLGGVRLTGPPRGV